MVVVATAEAEKVGGVVVTGNLKGDSSKEEVTSLRCGLFEVKSCMILPRQLRVQ